jgi:hypothetical protein
MSGFGLCATSVLMISLPISVSEIYLGSIAAAFRFLLFPRPDGITAATGLPFAV